MKMAIPSGRTTNKRRRTRSNFKKNQPARSYTISSKDSSSSSSDEVVIISNNNKSVCLTPKGEKFRIPEISTCPPPPKKPRIITSNSSLRKSLSFFSPPDLDDLFFCLALSSSSTQDLSLPFLC
ncbi:hypothetical protein PIB30_003154 [Stylosanthes scabra]|uniref:Uncharacterized protein n=1 Tax=Stylosanthes scabra TaxID=79078 RepID=A0ABU6Z2F9_9FABA|nr:hypothetical protein [Stylosanthes scabra]